VPRDTGRIQTLHKQLAELWIQHGAQDASSELALMQNRAKEVIENVASRSWEDYRWRCEEYLASSRRLWTQAEGLITAVADVGENGDHVSKLLADCNRLLSACDRLVDSEEEILQLNDLSAETYVFAHEAKQLVWQR